MAPLQDGLTIEGEIVRREKRLAQLQTAREVIEARASEAAAFEKAERAAAQAERAARAALGEKLRGKVPAGPESVVETPSPKDQYNYTDPASRIMKTGSGFEQCYNAQLAVEIESRLIIGQRVSECGKPTRDQRASERATPRTVARAKSRSLRARLAPR